MNNLSDVDNFCNGINASYSGTTPHVSSNVILSSPRQLSFASKCHDHSLETGISPRSLRNSISELSEFNSTSSGYSTDCMQASYSEPFSSSINATEDRSVVNACFKYSNSDTYHRTEFPDHCSTPYPQHFSKVHFDPQPPTKCINDVNYPPYQANISPSPDLVRNIYPTNNSTHNNSQTHELSVRNHQTHRPGLSRDQILTYNGDTSSFNSPIPHHYNKAFGMRTISSNFNSPSSTQTNFQSNMRSQKSTFNHEPRSPPHFLGTGSSMPPASYPDYIKCTSRSFDRTHSDNSHLNSTNQSTYFIPSYSSKSIPSSQTTSYSESKYRVPIVQPYKRRPSRVSNGQPKRRRSSNSSQDQTLNTIDTLNCLKTLGNSLVLKNPNQQIQNPAIRLPTDLIAPVPKPQSSTSLTDPAGGYTRHKYTTFPLMLRYCDVSSDSEIFTNLSRIHSKQVDDDSIIQNNNLLDSSRKTIVNSFRPICSSVVDTVSNSRPCSPIETLIPSFPLTSPGRATPPLSRPLQLEHSDLNHRQPAIIPNSSNVLISSTLVAKSASFCSICKSQLYSNNFSPHKDYEVANTIFCSQSCYLKFSRLGCSPKDVPFSFDLGGIFEVASILSPTTTTCQTHVVLARLHNNVRSSKLLAKKNHSIDVKTFRSRASRLYHRLNPMRWRRFVKSFGLTHPSSDVPVTIQRSTLLRSRSNSSDQRRCSLCQEVGDRDDHASGRLINYGLDSWVHVNCILWCHCTYETESGSIEDIDRSMAKARSTICSHCNRPGAGLPCFDPDCPSYYHLPCAFNLGCSFQPDRGMHCPQHLDNDGDTSTSLSVDRRVYVSREESSQIAEALFGGDNATSPTTTTDDDNDSSTSHHSPPSSTTRLRIGSLMLHEIGQLLPDQLASGLYHNEQFIYPIGYSASRVYWSYRHPSRRCHYLCRIVERRKRPSSFVPPSQPPGSTNLDVQFVVSVYEDGGEPPISFRAFSCDNLWRQIAVKINSLRHRLGLRRIMCDYVKGETFFGLTEPHIIRIIESLPGVAKLSNYTFRFGRFELIREMPLAINPTGCARSEPKLRTYFRRPHIQTHRSVDHHHAHHRSSSTGPSSPPPSSSHSANKIQLFRKLKLEWPCNVVLARSRIQGLGLYSARDIANNTYIIEYLGDLIRQEIGNLREQLYESQNRGVYMFRVDDDYIVDATMCGGLARYINHSCSPNCTAEVVNCDNSPHIVIIACRDIPQGEELTYDYKFDFEDGQRERIPCLCGSANCRKWMN